MEPQKRLISLAPEERQRVEREQARERGKHIKKVLVAALKDAGWQREPLSRWSWQGEDLTWSVRLDKGSWGPWRVDLQADWRAEGNTTEQGYYVRISPDRIGPEDADKRRRWVWALDHHDPKPLEGRDDSLRELIAFTCAWAQATPSVAALKSALNAGELRTPLSNPEAREALGYDPTRQGRPLE